MSLGKIVLTNVKKSKIVMKMLGEEEKSIFSDVFWDVTNKDNHCVCNT